MEDRAFTTRRPRWLTGLQKAIAKLAERPLRHPVAIEESERFGIEIRECLYGKRRGVFRILFTIVRDIISVLAIRHTAQDWSFANSRSVL